MDRKFHCPKITENINLYKKRKKIICDIYEITSNKVKKLRYSIHNYFIYFTKLFSASRKIYHVKSNDKYYIFFFIK